MTKSRVILISMFVLFTGQLARPHLVLAQARTLLFQNFDTVFSPWLPAGWSTTTVRRTSGDWFDTALAAVSPPQVCYSRDATKEQILGSPAVDFSLYDADSVLFYARRSASFDAVISVEVSVDSGSTWTTIDTLSAAIPTGSFRRFGFRIPPAVNGKGSAFFRYRNRGDGTGSSGVTRLDDFTVRGVPSGLIDGSGTALIQPASRAAGLTSVAETLTVTGSGTDRIEGIRITIPASWEWTDTSALILMADGFDSAFSYVSGLGSIDDPYTVTILDASVNAAKSGTVILRSLSTPIGSAVTEFAVLTRGEGGTFQPIASSPSVMITSLKREALSSGRWGDPAVWSGGEVPGTADTVLIAKPFVEVTIDRPDAHCGTLLLSGSGSSPGSGPLLRFADTGAVCLTVHGDLSISGGSGGGGGDRGGRSRLTSGGNLGAALVIWGNIITTTSNSPSNGNAGLDMNEGSVLLAGSSADTLRNSAGLRLGDLTIGDGLRVKRLVWAPSVSSLLVIRSLRLRSNASFLIGNAANDRAGEIGNASLAGVPTLRGGIILEAGGSLLVQDHPGGTAVASINLDGGGITNEGTLELISPGGGSSYNLAVGGLPAGSPSSEQVVKGSGTGHFADILVARSHRIILETSMEVGPGYSLVLDGDITETPGNTVQGRLQAKRYLRGDTAETFGGIGLEISAQRAMDTTSVSRVCGIASTGGAGSSILRYFDVSPAVNEGLGAVMEFHYNIEELAGQDEASLGLWKSTDGGLHWSARGGSVDTVRHVLRADNVSSFSRWTAADAAHYLGELTHRAVMRRGWNIVSVPVAAVDYRKSILFPQALSAAYAYSDGYIIRDTLSPGVGYWMKFASADTVAFAGVARSADTISLASGWNLIGASGEALPVREILEVPPGIVTSRYFGYESGYRPVDTLLPACGYWVKASQRGSLVLRPPVNEPQTPGKIPRTPRSR